MANTYYVHRDLDWLNFNGRVLQEAKDKTLPLYERIKFIAIFSSNLDEFYRIKVAAIQKLSLLKRKHAKQWLTFLPEELLANISAKVLQQQEALGEVWHNEILPSLAEHQIVLHQDENFSGTHRAFLRDHFHTNVLSHVSFHLVSPKKKAVIENGVLYLVARLTHKVSKKELFGLVRIPKTLPRFVELPKLFSVHHIAFLDDILRIHFERFFPDYFISSLIYSIKLNRDEDVSIEDELWGDSLDSVKEKLKKRKDGAPVRLLYDKAMGEDVLKELVSCIAMGKASAIPGGRYHNLHDLFTLPNPVGKQLEVTPQAPLVSPELETSPSLFGAIRRTDYLLYYPYQSYKYVLRFLNEAIIHPDVIRIEITLYRISEQSQIALALCNAARSGKEVIVFVEVKARYDELNNLYWADQMKQAGVKIFYGLPVVKVHAKAALVTQKSRNGKLVRYAYLSTGNFNEKTARVYADYGFFTSDKFITQDLASLFSLLQQNKPDRTTRFKALLVAGFNMKQSLIDLIDQEIKNVKKGLSGKIYLKLNGLDELSMINKLYEASQKGVEVKLIVRSGCSLLPGIKGISESIQAYRLIDRYLEHARIYYFYQNGREQIYLSSADWMHRNLNKRIEVAFPISKEELKDQVRYAFELQWSDTIKLTPISENHTISGCSPVPTAVRAQYAIYDWLKKSSTIQQPQPTL